MGSRVLWAAKFDEDVGERFILAAFHPTVLSTPLDYAVLLLLVGNNRISTT